MARTHRSPVPPNAMACRAFARADYADAFTIQLPSSEAGMPERFARAMFESPPNWVLALSNLRDRIVSLFGLRKTEELFRKGPADREGKILMQTGNEILLGADDRHLDFRISILGSEICGGTEICVVTAVKLNNLLGRLYLLPIKPMHRLIVPAMMRRAALTLAQAH